MQNTVGKNLKEAYNKQFHKNQCMLQIPFESMPNTVLWILAAGYIFLLTKKTPQKRENFHRLVREVLFLGVSFYIIIFIQDWTYAKDSGSDLLNKPELFFILTSIHTLAFAAATLVMLPATQFSYDWIKKFIPKPKNLEPTPRFIANLLALSITILTLWFYLKSYPITFERFISSSLVIGITYKTFQDQFTGPQSEKIFKTAFLALQASIISSILGLFLLSSYSTWIAEIK